MWMPSGWLPSTGQQRVTNESGTAIKKKRSPLMPLGMGGVLFYFKNAGIFEFFYTPLHALALLAHWRGEKCFFSRTCR